MAARLFVQTGNARPKCVYREVPEWLSRRAGEKLLEFYYEKALGTVRLAWMYGAWMKPFRAADRWWLVECENAEAGRAIIEWARIAPGRPSKLGRILASGGKT